MHLGIIFQCDLCDYNVLYRGDMKRHITAKHLGTKYACDQYSFKTNSKSSLNILNNYIQNATILDKLNTLKSYMLIEVT